MARFDLNPLEWGDTWSIREAIMVMSPILNALLYPEFEHDGDTGIPNIKEPLEGVPPLIVAATHDLGYWHRIDMYGRYQPREKWDRLYYYMSKHSNSAIRRRLARLLFRGVRTLGGRWAWDKREDPVPIPEEWQHLYGDTPEAFAERMKIPRVMVNSCGRLDVLPPAVACR